MLYIKSRIIMGSVRTICLGEQTSHLYIGCNLSSSQKTWAVVPTKVGIKSEDYATMEHEGVTSPCSFFFLPFWAVYQPRPKGQPTPPAGVSSKQILNGKESLSRMFPAGGLPSYMPQHDAAHKSGPEGRGLHAAEPTVIVSGKKAVVAMTCPEMY